MAEGMTQEDFHGRSDLCDNRSCRLYVNLAIAVASAIVDLLSLAPHGKLFAVFGDGGEGQAGVIGVDFDLRP